MKRRNYVPTDDVVRRLTERDSLRPRDAVWLIFAERMLLVVGLICTVLRHGLRSVTTALDLELGLITFLVMLFFAVSLRVRYRWSRFKVTYRQENRLPIVVSIVWAIGVVLIFAFGSPFPQGAEAWPARLKAIAGWSEIWLAVRAVASAIAVTRRSTASSRLSPGLILVLSFVFLILGGTILLMVPKSYANPHDLELGFLERLRYAVFTSTSASCVTGLTVVDTGGDFPYWSRMGQTVILCLFQIGGLGIMTFGALFAIASGRQMRIRESVALYEVFDVEEPGHVRRLVIGIFGFTAAAEILGAALLLGLWEGLPLGERIYQSIFHSVSAFCNAGFTLTNNSFVGYGDRWQVWGVIAALVIIGGLGFGVLYDLAAAYQSRRHGSRIQPLFNRLPNHKKLSISSRIILTTTVALLVLGAVGYHYLEHMAPPNSSGARVTWADAWFQSMTFRTAGFNSVNHGEMQPATKLLAIVLMFIGAAPGSTGGGVKVTCFALAVLRYVSILRGKSRVEIGHRTIPEELVNRAMTVMALGVMVVMGTTMLLVIFESREARFLDHLFEATSAFATVGVSAIGTSELQPASQMVIVATMFLGRVGPLTILFGLAGPRRNPGYAYPEERVTLG